MPGLGRDPLPGAAPSSAGPAPASARGDAAPRPRRRGRAGRIAVAALVGGAALSAAGPAAPAPVTMGLHPVPLPPASADGPAPEPSTASLRAAAPPPMGTPPPPFSEHPLRPHEVFGFAPYWSLGLAGGYPLQALTTVAYFGVDVAGDGSLVQSGPGWDGYRSGDLAALVRRAHAAGAGVVLTAKCFDAATLHGLVNDPQAAARLAGALAGAIRARDMDGANLDLEGAGGQDRTAFAAFATAVAGALHAVDPRWQVTVDTYTDSASDSGGYFDVARIAPAVDALFVMAYDMQGAQPSPVAPLTGPGSNDTASVMAYRSAVPPSKVILGIPFYGVDWPTTGGDRSATATGPPRPTTYGELAAGGRPEYWDPAAGTPWTSFQDGGGQWHVAFYEDPQSVAMKAELADAAGLRGVGVWALGMDGNDPAMAAALLGQAAPVKLPLGPVASPAPVPPVAQVAAPTAPPPRAPAPPPRPQPQPPAPLPPAPAPLPPLAPPPPIPRPVG